MSKRKRCTARHPDTGQRCEKRQHAYGDDHRIWRKRPPGDELTWENIAPCICAERRAEAEAWCRNRLPSKFPGYHYHCERHGRVQLFEEPTEDQIYLNSLPSSEMPGAGHIPINQVPGPPALLESIWLSISILLICSVSAFSFITNC